MQERLDALNSPEGVAIRSTAVAARKANRQVFEDKVNALPGCIEAHNKWRSHLDMMNKLWSKYEKMIKPLREEMDAAALRINNEEFEALSTLTKRFSGN